MAKNVRPLTATEAVEGSGHRPHGICSQGCLKKSLSEVLLEVLGDVDRGRATGTEFVLDGVAVRESGFQSFEGVGHRLIRCDLGYDRARFAEFGALLGYRRQKGRSEERPFWLRTCCSATVCFITPPGTRTRTYRLRVKSNLA